MTNITDLRNKYTGKIIAYERVSKDTQETANQEHLIKAFAHDNSLTIDTWLRIELSSRKSQADRQIDSLVDSLEKGDILIVTDLDRLGRGMVELIVLWHTLNKKGVLLWFVTDTTLNPTGDELADTMRVSLVAYFAESERQRISRRTTSALARKKKQGYKLGHNKQFLKSKYDADEEKIYDLKENHKMSYEKIVSLLDSDGKKGYKAKSLREYFIRRYEFVKGGLTGDLWQRTKAYEEHLTTESKKD